MYYEKHRSSQYAGSLRKCRIVVTLLLAAAIMLTINIQVRRVVTNTALIYAENAFSDAVSTAVINIIDQGCSFDVVTVSTSEDGQIVSVQSDTGRVNALKAHLTAELLDRLPLTDSQPIALSLGTLTGMELLAGLGPTVQLRLELRGGVKTEINSEFFDAGINQTLHRITCTVSAEYMIIIPGHRFASTLTTKIPLAESVIVGTVPDAYTYVVGDQSDTIGRIFDYGAQAGE